MRHKNQALQKFKEYLAENVTPCILQSDNGTEYTNKIFKQFGTKNKIKREYTVPETQEQNGITDRCNRAVVETARSHLIESKLRKSYRLCAVDTAADVRNIVKKLKPTKAPTKDFGVENQKQDI